MKIAVIGAGGYFVGRLAQAGIDVPVNRFVYHCMLPMEHRARKVHHNF